MTRKDYQLIATAIQAAFQTLWLKSPLHSDAHIESARRAVVGELSQVLKRDNPRFDASRFIDACSEEQA